MLSLLKRRLPSKSLLPRCQPRYTSSTSSQPPESSPAPEPATISSSPESQPSPVLNDIPEPTETVVDPLETETSTPTMDRLRRVLGDERSPAYFQTRVEVPASRFLAINGLPKGKFYQIHPEVLAERLADILGAYGSVRVEIPVPLDEHEQRLRTNRVGLCGYAKFPDIAHAVNALEASWAEATARRFAIGRHRFYLNYQHKSFLPLTSSTKKRYQLVVAEK
ncbi:hypothetical protein CPB85DRAFT_1310178 [Mucidula mucida]|nr:hypothetical protein CPB85DRAFT_417287 [Mucidula mucida]KAF8908280.1 hypothetical protein CPB85DRAFT_1310178 [Mucidula mucida]